MARITVDCKSGYRCHDLAFTAGFCLNSCRSDSSGHLPLVMHLFWRLPVLKFCRDSGLPLVVLNEYLSKDLEADFGSIECFVIH